MYKMKVMVTTPKAIKMMPVLVSYIDTIDGKTFRVVERETTAGDVTYQYFAYSEATREYDAPLPDGSSPAGIIRRVQKKGEINRVPREWHLILTSPYDLEAIFEQTIGRADRRKNAGDYELVVSMQDKVFTENQDLTSRTSPALRMPCAGTTRRLSPSCSGRCAIR